MLTDAATKLSWGLLRGFSTATSAPCRDGTWGDHVTLQAAADYYNIRIALVTSFPQESFIEVVPQRDQHAPRTVYLSFWAEVHYGSLYPAGQVPQEQHDSKVLGSKRLGKLFHPFD